MQSALAFDTETNGLKPHGGNSMFAYSTCDEDAYIQVVRMTERNADKRLADVLSGRHLVVMHSAKFDLSFAEKRLGRRVAEVVPFDDTKTMSHMLRNNHHGHGLKDLAWELAGYAKDDEVEVKAHARNAEDVDYSRVPEPIMRRYQERDAYRTMMLWRFFRPKLTGKLLDCYTWERDVTVPTMRMEERGITIDKKITARLADELTADARVAADEFCACYGRRVNVGSNDVLRFIFYTEKRLPVLDKTKKSGLPSVEKEILLALYEQTKDPLLLLALRYQARKRGASTLRSYIEAAAEDGTIHPTIHPLGAAATGRESMSDPNLQNVEKEGRLRNPFPTPARRCFRPRPGYVNFMVDYAGIELRLLVHYSKDPELVAEIAKPDGDPHALAAAIFYQPFTDEERAAYPDFCELNPTIAAGFLAFERKSKEWSQLRDPAKNTNFAVPYGSGADKATATLNLPKEIGLARFAEYRARFPRLCNMTRDIVATVKTKRGVETTFGRHLYVPQNKAYVGVNYLIQGTAAEILKRAQVRVHRLLERETGGECKLLIPIHDELIIEWPRKRLGDARAVWRKIRAEMIDFPQFDVPLEVETSVSTIDWSKKRGFNFMEDES